ncbi:MAG TPA: asparagine--tRNA ligase [Atribacterota bacterium]|nr:asparagine--tRNA ligase [Atribacterota bacterium]HPK86407.1 asparagine--tRNA ligase [Atribacterota bacterium]
MKVISISEVGNYESENVCIKGWLYNQRSSGKVKFMVIRDGTGFLQGTLIKGEMEEQYFNLLDELNYESSIMVEGMIKKEQRAPSGYEILVNTIQVVQNAQEDYPISLKKHGVAFLMNYRHLWLRTQRQNAILRIRVEIVKAIHHFLQQKGFYLIEAPILTPAACEGTTTLFETDYFDDKAYLTQSGQLYNEAAAMAFGKVYCFGPTFRAEKSKTRRHLMEFWMVEPEAAYFDFEDNNQLQEELVIAIVRQVLQNCTLELKTLERDIAHLEKIQSPFPYLSYDDAIKIIQKEGSTTQWGDDLTGEDETIVSRNYDRPVFIHHFPTKCKAFYMKPDPSRPETVLGADLIAPEGFGEIIGGGQRIDDYELIKKRIQEHNLPEEDYQWYIDLRRFGSVPHSGFGLGIERTVAWICNLSHIRETIAFPRMLHKIYP